MLLAPLGNGRVALLAQRRKGTLEGYEDWQPWIGEHHCQELGAFSWRPPAFDLDEHVADTEVGCVLLVQDVPELFRFVLVGEPPVIEGSANLFLQL